MRRELVAGALLLALLVGHACSESPIPTAVNDDVSLSKGSSGSGGGGGNTDTDPRAIWEIFAETDGAGAAKVIGDGRGALGGALTAPELSGVYQNDRCGVSGRIWAAGSRDATIDPDGSFGSKTACGPTRRILRVDLGGDHGAREAHFTNARGIDSLSALGEGTTVQQTLQVLVANFAPCSYLRFGFSDAGVPATDPIEVRYEGVHDGRRVWTLYSIGNHGAVCYRTDKNKILYDGFGVRTIPLKIRIVEVPHGS